MAATAHFLPGEGRPLVCEVVPERDRVRVIVEGELDIGTVGTLAARIRELRDVGFRDLVLDLRRLAFMDARGVHLILDADADCRRDGGSVQVIATGSPRRLLELCAASPEARHLEMVSTGGTMGGVAAHRVARRRRHSDRRRRGATG